MDRRGFVNRLAVISAGALVLPGIDVFADNAGGGELIKLQPTSTHVRHGMFNIFDNDARRNLVRDWVNSLKRNRFYQNGYSQSKEDPYLVSVETSKGENVQIMLQGDSVNCFINSKKLKAGNDHRFKTDNLEICVIDFTGSASQVLMLKGKKAFFVPLEGKVKVGTVTLMDEIGLVLDDKHSVEVKGNGTAKLLLITEI